MTQSISPTPAGAREPWRDRLNAPLFDCIRVPSRSTVDSIATRVCASHGMTTDQMRGNKGNWTNVRARVRDEIVAELRAHQISPKYIAAWFWVSEQSIFVWEGGQ